MPDMTSAQAAALWSGLLILLLVILSVRVVLQRQKHRVVLGDGGNADLRPYTAKQGDASLEWYFADKSIVNVAVYYKRISNQITTSCQMLSGISVALMHGTSAEKKMTCETQTI